ncbi:MAG TPA: hypothetical protein VFA59_18390 [Vicinamibacterales bacterium]|nr:hypothetical protein [Vicinamibacterales bacterium]
MRFAPTAIVVFVASASLFAQSKSASKKSAPPPKPISISGCVTRSADDTAYTVEDETNGTYRLSGTDVRDFLGQKVQLSGGVIETKKLRIRGGLVPNANVAGQAGAIDPTQAANAVAGGQAPTGNVQLPEFRVKSIRPLGSNCGK